MGDVRLKREMYNLNEIFNSSVKNLINYHNSRIYGVSKSIMMPKIKSLKIKDNINYFNVEYTKLKNRLNLEIRHARTKCARSISTDKAIPGKIALVIGCNYLGTTHKLSGCINDAENIKKLLKTKYAFDNINIITDTTHVTPTKTNILDGLKNMLNNSITGDKLFFSFCGHASRIKDKNGDEPSGYDGIIRCLNSEIIVDDEIKLIIDNNLKKDTSLFALIDACHSGTIMDLRYQYLDSTNLDKSTINEKQVETIGSVVMISGCMDSQSSYETPSAQGAMTYSFLNAPHSNTMTWNSLIVYMRNYLKKKSYAQTPQISSGKALDLNAIVSLV